MAFRNTFGMGGDETDDMDPIMGAAVGAAAKAATTTADDPKLRHAVLLPAAKVVGHELELFVTNFFERNRQKKIENVEAQIRRSERVESRRSVDDVVDDPAFADWVRGVADVDPQDLELSDIWQAALLSLREGGPRRARILAIAKKMTADEAIEFMSFVSLRRYRLAQAYRKRFVDLGLLESAVGSLGRGANRMLAFALASVVLMIPLVFVSQDYLRFTAERRDFDGGLSTSAVVRLDRMQFDTRFIVESAALAVFMIAVFLAYRAFQVPRPLTEDGQALAILSKRISVGGARPEPVAAPPPPVQSEPPRARRVRRTKAADPPVPDDLEGF